MFLHAIPTDILLNIYVFFLKNEVTKKHARKRTSGLILPDYWGSVGCEAGTSTVFGPWAIALANKSSWDLNGSWNGLGPRLLVTGKVKTQPKIDLVNMDTWGEHHNLTSFSPYKAGKGSLLKGVWLRGVWSYLHGSLICRLFQQVLQSLQNHLPSSDKP